MFWKMKEEPEPPLDTPLGFLVHRIDIELQAACILCEAVQPVYLKKMLEKHRKTTTLRSALETEPCLFCKVEGMLKVRVATY
jgi:hypothetical protein